jgi:cytoskeleton protein RodZ
MESLMHEVMPGKDSQPWLQYILGSILVLLFLLAWFFYMDYMPKPVSAEADKTAVVVAATDNAPVEINMPEIALPAEERLTEGTDVDATKAATSDASAATTTSTTPVTAAVPKAAVVENIETAAKPKLPLVASAAIADKAPVPAVPAAAALKAEAVVKTEAAAPAMPKVASANMKKVTMAFSDESWLRATDKSGKVVFEKILPAGSQDSFEGLPPFNLVIGNASATKLIYQGKPVDLAAVTQSNVARLTLE